MAVKIGSARMGENGKITGGKPGDQTGREVSTQNWYAHSKGWRVFRARDAYARERIAKAMERACANNRIGYNQNQRNDLFNQVRDAGFDPSAAKRDTQTDCSALVRVCCRYAGIVVGNFNTATEASYLMNTGAFTELTGSEYTKSADRLCRGDILVTRTKGHTVVVLSNGKKADTAPAKPMVIGDRILRNGSEGDDVRHLQSMLIQLGYDCGRWGADGDFGDMTEMAVRSFQRDYNLDVDGEAGPDTIGSLIDQLRDDAQEGAAVRIVGGKCYVRDAPNTNGAKLGTAQEGSVHVYAGEASEDGWLKIQYADGAGWVSGKYARLEKSAQGEK